MGRSTRKTVPGSVRMREVAELAQVSAMTVSRALRSPRTVSEETLARVSRAIAELGYVPNQLAGSLKTFNNTKVIGVIVPSVRNAVLADTLKGLSDELANRGFSILLGDSDHSNAQDKDLVFALLAQRPRAMVLHETVHPETARTLLERSGIPIVEIGDLTSHPIDMVVSYSNYAASKAMTSYLIRRGYKRIAFVSLPLVLTRSRLRLRGYKGALREAGISFAEDIILESAAGYGAGAEAMSRLLAIRPRVDAAFFAGDVLAIGGLLECQRRRVSVPSRIAIAGFDDLEMSSQLVPSLTVLRIPRYEIGREAARSILERLSGNSGERSNTIDVGFSVLEREST